MATPSRKPTGTARPEYRMYLPKHFTEDRLSVLHDAIEAADLAILISAEDDLPQATHLPLLLDRNAGTRGKLRGHFARANPQWRALEAGAPALIIASGPQAYVSPSWYPSKAEGGRVVPTWNYIVVHATGPVTVFHEADRLLRLVSDLTDRHEQGRIPAWAVSDAPPDYIATQLAGIVGFEMTIERLEGKWKMSQNRSTADREGVRTGLRRQGRDDVADVL
jgi:transcriptional regulator